MQLSLKHSASTDIGGRSAQQDVHLIISDLFKEKPGTTPPTPKCSLFAVLDGHGTDGGKASTFATKILPQILKEHKQLLMDDPEAALKQVFARIHQDLVENQDIDTYMSGTTAIVVLVMDGKLIVSHLGDSRGVLVRREPESQEDAAGEEGKAIPNAEAELEKSKGRWSGFQLTK